VETKQANDADREDADSDRWGIWSHGAKTREANFQFDEIYLYNLNDWSTTFRHVRK
jgi:hypothetical protein